MSMDKTLLTDYIHHLERMEQELRVFYEANKLVFVGDFDAHHSRDLRSSLVKIKFVINLTKEFSLSDVSPLHDWFEHQNIFLESLIGESIDNYYVALINAKNVLGSVSDLIYELDRLGSTHKEVLKWSVLSAKKS